MGDCSLNGAVNKQNEIKRLVFGEERIILFQRFTGYKYTAFQEAAFGFLAVVAAEIVSHLVVFLIFVGSGVAGGNIVVEVILLIFVERAAGEYLLR